jgi:hypothetical protein
MRMPLAARDRARALGTLVGDDLDSPVGDASRREQAVRDPLQLVASPAQDDDLQATMLVEMNVQRRAHPIAELMLELGEPLGELSNVMVVDERQRGNRGSSTCHLCAHDLCPNEVTQQLGAGHPALLHEDIQVLEQRPLHRDAEPRKLRLHLGERTRDPTRASRAGLHADGAEAKDTCSALTIW